MLLAVVFLCMVIALVFGMELGHISRGVWNFLVVNQEPRPADVIIVLASDTARIEEGVRLYQLGYADKILFTAVGSQDMASQARSLGVTEDAIIVEEKARTTHDEAVYSAQVMRAQGFQSAIVVTSSYHSRRASIIFGQFFRGWNLTVCSVPYDPAAPDNWWRNRETASAVISEYMKLALHFVLPAWV